jgi:hypothetical protein
MAIRMARKMDYPESIPKRKQISLRIRELNGRGLIAQDLAAHGFEPSAPTACARIREGAIDVGLFGRMGVNGGPGQALDGGEISSMVQVAVGQKDGADIGGPELQTAKEPLEQKNLPHQAGVDKDCFSPGIHQEVAESHNAAKGVQARGERNSHQLKMRLSFRKSPLFFQ